MIHHRTNHLPGDNFIAVRPDTLPVDADRLFAVIENVPGKKYFHPARLKIVPQRIRALLGEMRYSRRISGTT